MSSQISSFTKEDAKHAAGVLNWVSLQIQDFLKSEYHASFNIQIGQDNGSGNQMDALVRKIFDRHEQHLKTHNVKQRCLDVMKLTCWYVGELLSRLERDEGGEYQAKMIINASVFCLQTILRLETEPSQQLSNETARLISDFALEEFRNNGDHGIGMNGLFMAFHCARESFQISQKANQEDDDAAA